MASPGLSELYRPVLGDASGLSPSAERANTSFEKTVHRHDSKLLAASHGHRAPTQNGVPDISTPGQHQSIEIQQATVPQNLDLSRMMSEHHAPETSDRPTPEVLRPHDLPLGVLTRIIGDTLDYHPALRGMAALSGYSTLLDLPFQGLTQELKSSSVQSQSIGPTVSEKNGSSSTRHFVRELDWSSHISTNGFPIALQQQQLRVFQEPEWALLPLSFDDGSLMSRTYLSFWKAAGIMIAAGVPSEVILGGRQPVVDLFFHPRPDAERYDVSSWASSLLSSFHAFDSATLLAHVVVYFKFMRVSVTLLPEDYTTDSRFNSG